MLNDLVGDSPLLTSCSGFCCGKPGTDGSGRSSWLHHGRLLTGVVLGFGCTGNSFPESDLREVESLSAKSRALISAMSSENRCETWASTKCCPPPDPLGSEPMW